MNNNKLYLKLFLFFLGVEIIFLWISFKKLSLVILWILNTIVILFMFFDFKINLNFLKDRLSWFINSLNKFFDKKGKINIENTKKKIDFNIDNLKTFLEPVKYFYLKGGFVLSIIVLVLAILDHVILHRFNLSIFWSAIFFIVWLFVLYKNILDGEIYIWNKIVSSKDIILILSLFIILVVYVLLVKFAFYEKIFYSLVFGLLFYIVAIFSLDYTNTRLKLFKSVFLYSYLWLTLLSFFVYLYHKVPAIKKSFTIEKIVYKEKPVYKEKIVYKDRIIIKKTNPSKIYIAPNDKVYELFFTSTWVYFSWYNDTRRYFNSYKKAVSIINKYNQKHEIKKNSEIKKNVSKSTLSSNNNLDNNSNRAPTIKDVISSLLNGDEGKITQDVNYKKVNTNLTYNNIIPYLISKYWLNSNNKPNITFKYISKNNQNYKYFKVAYFYKMFGKNSNPNLRVRCRNFAVLLWLAEWWNVNYNRNNVFNVFYQKAIKKWYKFDTCCKSQYDYLTKDKKTCILK